MKTYGDIGSKKARRLQDPARRRVYAQSRSRRYGDYLAALAAQEVRRADRRALAAESGE